MVLNPTAFDTSLQKRNWKWKKYQKEIPMNFVSGHYQQREWKTGRQKDVLGNILEQFAKYWNEKLWFIKHLYYQGQNFLNKYISPEEIFQVASSYFYHLLNHFKGHSINMLIVDLILCPIDHLASTHFVSSSVHVVIERPHVIIEVTYYIITSHMQYNMTLKMYCISIRFLWPYNQLRFIYWTDNLNRQIWPHFVFENIYICTTNVQEPIYRVEIWRWNYFSYCIKYQFVWKSF